MSPEVPQKTPAKRTMDTPKSRLGLFIFKYIFRLVKKVLHQQMDIILNKVS